MGNSLTTGQIIKNKFNKLKISKVKFAGIVGISHVALNNILRGDNLPNLTTIYRMSLAFSCTIDDLIGADVVSKGVSTKLIDTINNLNMDNDNKNELLNVIKSFIDLVEDKK